MLAGRPGVLGRLQPSAQRAAAPSAPQRRPSAARMVVTGAAGAGIQPQVPGFSDSNVESATVAILGDLHLEPSQMDLFEEAKRQLVAAMSHPVTGKPLAGARVVQLGDLGGYKYQPGSTECFRVAREYLDGFGVPRALVTGNHDLEGDEFETDPANLAAWHQAFGQSHYWAVELGPAIAVGMSTVRFRSNNFSVHEVYVDDAQVAWFESLLAQHPNRPFIVFTHAPPMGSGLKVVQEVHVKNRCAWLNHSDRPKRFIDIVQRHPGAVRLWFSGHFHLSHNYADSISVVGSCAFVQTGVIGATSTRDGFRHSRLLRLDTAGYQLYTVDHEDGALRLDLAHGWANAGVPAPIIPLDEVVCDPDDGWLCSKLDCAIGQPADGVRWVPATANTMLALQSDMVVEYDMEACAAVGVVAFLKGATVALEATDGGSNPTAEDGSDLAALVLTHPDGTTTRLGRNEAGTFYRVFQPNKWLKKQQEKAAAAAAAAAAAVVTVS